MSVLEDIRLRLGELQEKTGVGLDPSEEPLTTLEIATAQRALGVKLPQPYVQIVTTVGNGPHGLFFKLSKDEAGWGWDSDDGCDSRTWLKKFLRKPFPHFGPASVHDHPFFSSEDWLRRTEEAEAEGPDAEDALSDWFEENRGDIIDEAWCDAHFQGSVAIKHYGCAIRDRLIVTGEMAGTVWHSPEGLDFELYPIQWKYPLRDEPTPTLSFDEWVLDHLERRLAGDEWS